MPQDLTPEQQLKALQAQLSHTTAQAELLQALNQAAQDILAALPALGTGDVLASDDDVLAACKSEVWVQRFARQQKALNAALNATLQASSGAAAAGQDMQAMSLGAALVALQTVPVVLNAIADAATLFRTDRTVSLFDVSEEAPRLLEHLLEHHAQQAAQPGSSPVQRIASVTPELVRQAELLLLTLDALRVLHDRGVERLGALQRAAQASLHQPGLQPAAPLPAPEMVAKLSRLSTGQREEINRQMLGLRNQGLGLDERRKIYENLVH